MKKRSCFFEILAFLLSNIMCAVVAYNYRELLCAIEHAGFSAPASIAFLYAVPFLIGIGFCLLFAHIFRKKD